MTDKVVLSEGPNDLLFLRQLHREIKDDSNFDTFDNEVEETSQTKRLTKHRIDDVFPILYKSEGGRQKLAKIFSDIVIQIADWELEIYILVDLDAESTSNLFDELNRELFIDYGNRVSVDEVSREINYDMLLLSCEFEISGMFVEPFEIFAFHTDLEDTINLLPREDQSAKIAKIETYIDNNPQVIEDIESHLF